MKNMQTRLIKTMLFLSMMTFFNSGYDFTVNQVIDRSFNQISLLPKKKEIDVIQINSVKLMMSFVKIINMNGVYNII